MDSHTLALRDLVDHLATAFKVVDASRPQGSSRTRTYLPGIGPLNEAETIKRALAVLQQRHPDVYRDARPRPYPGSRQLCDVVIPGQWAIEAKLIRPFGDNGVEAEHLVRERPPPIPRQHIGAGRLRQTARVGLR